MGALTRVRQLRAEGRTGVQIAEVLLQEDFTIEQAREAFYVDRYVVSIQPFTRDIAELHVSNHPEEAGLAAIIQSMAPQAMPSVVWKKKQSAD